MLLFCDACLRVEVFHAHDDRVEEYLQKRKQIVEDLLRRLTPKYSEHTDGETNHSNISKQRTIGQESTRDLGAPS